MRRERESFSYLQPSPREGRGKRRRKEGGFVAHMNEQGVVEREVEKAQWEGQFDSHSVPLSHTSLGDGNRLQHNAGRLDTQTERERLCMHYCF